MKRAWQRWTVAGLLAGSLVAGGCITRDDSEDTGAFRTPIQDKYQSPAAGAASNTGTGGSGGGHPSPQPDEQSSEDRQGGGTAAPRSLTEKQPLGEGMGGSGRAGDGTQVLGAQGLGTGLAESYDAAPPPPGAPPATGEGAQALPAEQAGQQGAGEPGGMEQGSGGVPGETREGE